MIPSLQFYTVYLLPLLLGLALPAQAIAVSQPTPIVGEVARTLEQSVKGIMESRLQGGISIGRRGAAPGVSGLPRARGVLKADPHHAFPNVVDNFAREATRFEVPTRGSGGSIVRTSELFQVEGSLNRLSGVFEWIVDREQITHRRFIPGGKVTGFPNQRPRK